MNTSTSDYSSGCESGWTMYLDHNSQSADPYSRGFYDRYEEKSAYTYAIHEEDDEDLSMVSDASSGPPHCRHYDNSQYYGYASEDKTKTKTKSKAKSNSRKEPKQLSFCLDDTASSSVFHFSQDNVPRSDDHNSVGNVYSTAHFEGESITKKRLNFFKSSTKGKSGSLLGRKRQ